MHNSVTATIIQNKINTLYRWQYEGFSRVQEELMFDLSDRISVVHTRIHTQLQIGRRLQEGLITMNGDASNIFLYSTRTLTATAFTIVQ